MRMILGCAFVVTAMPALAAEGTPSSVPPARPPLESVFRSDAPRFSAVPVPADPKSIWLVDTQTGSLTRCEFQTVDTVPKCTPWATVPGESPAYRWDAETKKLIPMNEAARKDAERQISK